MRAVALAAVFLTIQVQQANSQDATIRGGRGDDIVETHAVAGEPPIAQDYRAAGTGATGPNGETLRADDPDDPISANGRTYFLGQPFQDNVTLRGLSGADEFVVRTYISGKPAIVARHVDADGVIDWNAVAGENDNAHDHWVEYFGSVTIADFDAAEGDTLRVRGHTVALNRLDVVGGDTLVVVQSQQGNGGGAHDEDILGVILVEGARLSEADIEFDHANDGIVRTAAEFDDLVAGYEEVAEAEAARLAEQDARDAARRAREAELERRRQEQQARQNELQERYNRYRSRYRGRRR